MWSIWLEKNNRIFNAIYLSSLSLIIKVIHLLILWVFVAPEYNRQKMKESINSTKKSLKFLDTHVGDLRAPRKQTPCTGSSRLEELCRGPEKPPCSLARSLRILIQEPFMCFVLLSILIILLAPLLIDIFMLLCYFFNLFLLFFVDAWVSGLLL